MVQAYGLGASQLDRLKQQNIPLTVAVDKVAASGGYMMASVADKIVAAPFAIIGSIGVVAQVPNLHRFLKKHNIDFEQITAGEYKRTLSVFGENTKQGRKKAQEEVEDIHKYFKELIEKNRPYVDINDVATGEYWLASHAKDFKLVDELVTSDDYLLQASNDKDIFEVKFKIKQSMGKKFMKGSQNLIYQITNGV